MKLRQLASRDWKQVLAERKKTLANVATFLAGAAALGVVHGTALIVVELVLLAINPALVHQVKNADPKG